MKVPTQSQRDDQGTMVIRGTRFVWGLRTYIMGVVNMTPDSFSGDGLGLDVQTAVEQAIGFQDLGADIIDVGGESTRPPSVYTNSIPTLLEEEVSRVIPVIEALVPRVRIPVSIDTYKSEVARAALLSGASMINDVWGFTRDCKMAQVAADAAVPVILMHNQEHACYHDLVPDVIERLRHLAESAVRTGVHWENIILDPGIGFGKTADQNLEVLRRLDELLVLGRPLLVGTSRKSTIGEVLDVPVDQRVEGTAATIALSIASGADIVRVHDVKEMVKVARMSDAIVRGWKRD